MNADVYSIDGTKKGSIELPSVFTEEYRPDLIKRAFIAETSLQYQPKGPNKLAGMRTSATSWGVGGGMSRIPRVKAGPKRSGRQARGRTYRSKGRWFRAASRGSIMPGTTGGRQAHPPKPEKILIKRINKKEHKKALRAAIAATSNKELVEARGHKISQVKAIPLIVDDSIASLKTAKEALSAFEKLGLMEELARTKKRKIKSGKGKLRNRKYKRKVGPLIVVPEIKGAGIWNSASNLPGVEVTALVNLNVEKLAPGASAGRLTLWTKSCLEKMKTAGKERGE